MSLRAELVAIALARFQQALSVAAVLVEQCQGTRSKGVDMMIWLKRSSLLVLAVTAVAFVAGGASAVPLRSPQVVFNGGPLQGYLNSFGESINVATDQLNAQAWSISFTGNADFTLMLQSALGAGSAFGVYDATQPIGPFPPLYQVFPGGAVAGWYAELHFQSPNLLVTLHNQNGVIMGQTTYPGISGSNFAFYLQSIGGDWFSQDARNLGGNAQMLTYGSTGFPGDYWLCWNVPPYDPSGTFADVVIAVESVRPVPVRNVTWGSVKGTYHQ
jgi:hypothetical protein